ncbi:CLUMA_CG010224, isoform A [Clunio marinus]|uniref:CLUMA_CG010224, isoform A n=1 Tax=Clunio marinus TaxID=568069 RepID=A0A1J1I8R5_9DIPT|nr:CLUMA_CG010224, isoform A [Clunio marinus]
MPLIHFCLCKTASIHLVCVKVNEMLLRNRKDEKTEIFVTDTMSQDPEATLSQFQFIKNPLSFHPLPYRLPLRFFIDPSEMGSHQDDEYHR